MVDRNPGIRQYISIEKEIPDGQFEQVWSSKGRRRQPRIPKEFHELPMFLVVEDNGVEVRKTALNLSTIVAQQLGS